MGLFAGKPGGTYEREDIDQLRILYRRLGRSERYGGFAQMKRCEEIVQAWVDWRERKDADEAQSGLLEARRAQGAAQEEFIGLASVLAQTRATTVDGLIAKARGLQSVFTDDENITKTINRDMRLFGVFDDDTMALVIARDVLALAQRGEAAAGA
jgi:hypothetical protein